MTTGKARGKVILFGEHAVVYGVPAIAVGIDRGVTATAQARDAGPSQLRISESAASVGDAIAISEDDREAPIARAFADLLAVTRQERQVGPVSVEAVTELPPGGGLGCSAALGVAIARALDPEASSEVLAQRANDVWERVFHGNPSGVDAAVSALGGCVQFERRDGISAHIERVRVPSVVYLCIGNSGQASSTRSMVEAVARIHERRPDTTRKAFDAIHTLVRNARLAIEAGDVKAVGQLLDLNQMLLSGLFVSTPEIEQMCGAARQAGALGAKLTGAGGGGCVVALVDSPEAGARVLTAWKEEGFDGFATTFGEPRQLEISVVRRPNPPRAQGVIP